MGRSSQSKGSAGQQAAEIALKQMGYGMVETIHTGWSVNYREGEVVSARPQQSVSGDVRAIEIGTGRSLLAEVKVRDDDRLLYSALEPHQVECLTLHSEYGGISYLIWLSGSELFILDWKSLSPHFAPRKSLSIQQARQLNLYR